MKKSTKIVLTGAAIAGLLNGAFAAQARAAKVSGPDAGKSIRQLEKDKESCGGKNGCAGKDSCGGKASCKGQNACKGQGGCKSGDNGCKGKNSCKGKGGCNGKHVKSDQ